MGSARKRKVAKIESPYVTQQEKKVQTTVNKRRGLVRRLTFYAVCAAIISVLAVSTLVSQAAMLTEKEHKKEKLQTRLSELKKTEELLNEEIVKLNDEEYIAKLARRDYFLSDKGEIIFTIPKKKEESD